jgi:hypothetical protein
MPSLIGEGAEINSQISWPSMSRAGNSFHWVTFPVIALKNSLILRISGCIYSMREVIVEPHRPVLTTKVRDTAAPSTNINGI